MKKIACIYIVVEEMVYTFQMMMLVVWVNGTFGSLDNFRLIKKTTTALLQWMD
jgi:hypothetical protein